MLLQMSVILFNKETSLEFYLNSKISHKISYVYSLQFVCCLCFLCCPLQKRAADMIIITSAQMLTHCSPSLVSLLLFVNLETQTGRAALKTWKPVSVTELFPSHISDAALPVWND